MEWLYAAALAIEGIGMYVGYDAAKEAADYEKYQGELNARSAEIQGNMEATNRLIELRYSLGLNHAAMTAGQLGEGETFLAMRRKEQEVAYRDLRNLSLGVQTSKATTSGRSQAAKTRAHNLGVASLYSFAASAVEYGVDFMELRPAETVDRKTVQRGDPRDTGSA